MLDKWKEVRFCPQCNKDQEINCEHKYETLDGLGSIKTEYYLDTCSVCLTILDEGK